MSGVYRGLTSTLKPCQLQGPWILNTMLNSERWPGVCMNHPKIKHKLSNHKMSAVSGWGQGELGLNPLRDPAAYPDQGEAVGAWLGVWHLWVDAHPQEALRLGCLPPVWASWVHQPHRDLQCAPSAWNNITLNRFGDSCGDVGLAPLYKVIQQRKKIRGKNQYMENWGWMKL